MEKYIEDVKKYKGRWASWSAIDGMTIYDVAEELALKCEQLTARVKELEYEKNHAGIDCAFPCKSFATLEQQLKDARELSCDGCTNNNVRGKAPYCSDCLRIQNSFYVDKYEQAIAERDGGDIDTIDKQISDFAKFEPTLADIEAAISDAKGEARNGGEKKNG